MTKNTHFFNPILQKIYIRYFNHFFTSLQETKVIMGCYRFVHTIPQSTNTTYEKNKVILC